MVFSSPRRQSRVRAIIMFRDGGRDVCSFLHRALVIENSVSSLIMIHKAGQVGVRPSGSLRSTTLLSDTPSCNARTERGCK
jgi:hypothetical protein